jgi:GntR family transcriptional repressor for pyruvate dehydrogenase complex
MDDELIRVAGLAARVACQRMTPRYLKALSGSIEQMCCSPATFAWDRKATAYAEIANLLADAAADPALALLARNLPGHLYDLIVTAGPAADDIIASSRRRLLALIRARDADGAEREMEQHLEGLSWTVERRCVSVREATLWSPAYLIHRINWDVRAVSGQFGLEPAQW